MASEIQIQSNQFVNIMVTSNLTSFPSERRFDRGLTVAALKNKLELLTGAQPGNQKLEVYDKKDQLLFTLDNNEALLGSHHIDDGMRLHVVDKQGNIGEFEDVSRVEKFELSTDEYDQKKGTLRDFKRNMKLGQFKDVDPEEQKRLADEKQRKAEAEKEAAERIKEGDRCEVRTPGNPTRRGTVRFSGLVEFQSGYWIGVQFDEPLGKNDGSVKGKRYFECMPKYGGFVKPDQITVGDFPEEDIDMDDEDEI